MKIVLWGATGLTGREVLGQALEGGHEVKAVARNPEQIEVEHANLTVVRGDALNPKSVQEAIAGGEVVISTLGSGATLMQARKPTTIYSEGFANIVAAMRKHAIRRFIALVAVGTVPDPNEPLIHKRFIRPILRANYDDIRKAENVLAGCDDLDWIGIRPVRPMNTPRTGKYRTAVDILPPGGVEISRADVAELILKQLYTDEHLRSYLTIAY
ncbi:MAG: SDR family oxidoreductase [Deltaproteobacteria bacterium]|nr:SDR family oxidoreductase [Deltaproteobacteria bacterium]